jgi:hypothetical protein
VHRCNGDEKPRHYILSIATRPGHRKT